MISMISMKVFVKFYNIFYGNHGNHTMITYKTENHSMSIYENLAVIEQNFKMFLFMAISSHK